MGRSIRIRLYRIQDYDLYSLYYDPDFNFGKACRDALKAYVKGEAIPEIDASKLKHLKYGLPISTATSFAIKDEDTDIDEMLSKLNERNANNFIKHLVRRRMVNIGSLYFASEENDYSDPGVLKKKRAVLGEKEGKRACTKNRRTKC